MARSSSSSADPWIGRLVGGRWKLRSLLDDSGGMASVYLADDERLPRKAVVKIPRLAHLNAEFAERFAREAFWHAKVENLHVVHILDRGEEEGTPYLVLQYLPGGNLKAWCMKKPSMLADPRLHHDAWLLPIAQALDAVAEQGVVHRDVKPANILFDAAGKGYLSDFGIVKAGGEATMTGTGLFIGTLQFMSPEQCRPEAKRSLDGRSDQYGLAVTVYQVLTGWKYPVDDDTAVIYAAKFGHVAMMQPRDHEPRIPQSVNDAVMRALSVDRERRFGSSEQFVRAVLAGFGTAEAAAETGPAAMREPAPRPSPRRQPPGGGDPSDPAAVPATRGATASADGPRRVWSRDFLGLLLGACALAACFAGMCVIHALPLEPWGFGPRENSIGIVLVRIPAGRFRMGSEDGDAAARPVHEVRITRPFLCGQTEVTQGQWEAVMGTTPWQGRQYVKAGPWVAASYVRWDEAVEFCRRLTEKERQVGVLPAGQVYRLPTEAEWEYACRAGTETAFSFGDDETWLGDYAWWGGFVGGTRDRSAPHVHEVGLKKPNAWSLRDIHGNVAEWCSDKYEHDYYEKCPAVDPPGPISAGEVRVVRGGSWYDDHVHCRSAYRHGNAITSRNAGLGFRVVLGSE